MVSYGKARDREMRVMLMETMLSAVNRGDVNTVRLLGERSKYFADKISLHNYSSEDKRMELYQSIKNHE